MPDPFADAEARYPEIARAYSEGRLSPEALGQATAGLRAQDAEGRWWQLQIETGRWAVWDGARWVDAERSASQGAVQALAQSAAESATATARMAPGMLVRYLTWRLVPALVTGVGAWLFHTYLLVFKNDGFNPDTAISRWINVTGNSTSALAIWFVVSALGWSFLYAVFTVGPVKAVSAIAGAPFRFFGMLGRADRSGLGAMAAGAGIALVLGTRLGLNSQAGMVLAGGLGIFALGRPGGLAAAFLTGIISRFSAKRSKGSSAAASTTMRMMLAGVAPGILLVALLSPKLALMAGFGLVVFGALMAFGRGGQAPPAGHVVLLALAAGLATTLVFLLDDLLSGVASADDGGASECGKTSFTEYMTKHDDCAGADQALSNGYGPGAASAAGAATPPIAGGEEYTYALQMSANPASIVAKADQSAWVYAWVVTNDPKANVAAITSSITFSLSGDGSSLVQPRPPQPAGSAMAISLTARPPEDSEGGSFTCLVSAQASGPSGPFYASQPVEIKVDTQYKLELS